MNGNDAKLSFCLGHNYNVKVKALLTAVAKPRVKASRRLSRSARRATRYPSFRSAKLTMGGSTSDKVGAKTLWSNDLANFRTNALSLLKNALSSLAWNQRFSSLTSEIELLSAPANVKFEMKVCQIVN